jgi:hypothetical protein
MSAAERFEEPLVDIDLAQQLLDLCGGDALMALRSVNRCTLASATMRNHPSAKSHQQVLRLCSNS